ncbi:hypothetical protein OKW21_001160 [Catalinimonas alkaloidigena]|uniref:DUF4864 domain-containing protein n=1 Tax=Catalinimonas alkaloidigena TaxID=1075417 RepID=UPI0024061178|nr:DUF4864 domain-containing protein [Catalinimonas alkaloidigena]MDF9795897.1 hypothetical protein [Catalinimonas alkaloidigena]
MKRTLLISFSVLTVLFLAYILWNNNEPTSTEPESISVKSVREELVPLPSLGPQEVVNIQLQAMQNNNQPYENHGIEVAFRFASPSNKENTGPLNQFIKLVQNDTYSSLLNFKQYGLDDVDVKGDKAIQKVTLINEDDKPAVFYFKLSRQQEEPYADCWMTDGVIPY